MACSSCAQKRARMSLAASGVSEAAFSVGSEDLVLVLYTSPNIAMHNVRSLVGAMINGKPANYGRHRGANKDELSLYEAGELTVDKARSINAIPFSIFWVHPLEVTAGRGLFLPIEAKLTEVNGVESVEAVADESVAAASDEPVVIPSDSFDHKYLTKKVATSMAEAGMPTSALFFASASPEMISEHFRSSGKLSAEDKAAAVIRAAKEIAG